MAVMVRIDESMANICMGSIWGYVFIINAITALPSAVPPIAKHPCRDAVIPLVFLNAVIEDFIPIGEITPKPRPKIEIPRMSRGRLCIWAAAIIAKTIPESRTTDAPII